MSAPGRPEREQALERDGAEGRPTREVSVRRARQEDVPRIAAWNAQLIQDEHNDTGPPAGEIEPRLRDWLAKDFVACVFELTAPTLAAPGGGAIRPSGPPFGTDGPAPFGYAIFRDLPECVHLRHFFVEAAYRRRGLGRRAFESMRHMFPPGTRVLVEVLVANAAGAAFWKSVGFEPRYLGLQLNPGG